MKNIITAILNPEINKKLNKNKEINVICKDILYQEAIFDVLEKNNNIDFIIINSEIPGDLKKEDIILKINKINKKIKIIYLINENEKIEEKNIYKKILKKELNYKILENIILNKEKIIKKTENKKIIFLGNKGVGKSILLSNISLILSKKKIKIAIIDLDYNKTIYFIFNLKNKKIEKNNSIKINSYLYYFRNFNNYDLKKIELINLLNKLEKEFEIILIDSAMDFSENEKILIKNSNKKIFITEANLIEINKTKNILEKYNNKKIKTEDFEIIINKNNINSIDENLVKKIFKNKIIGKIDYYNKFNLLINEKIKEEIKNKKILKIIEQIKEI